VSLILQTLNLQIFAATNNLSSKEVSSVKLEKYNTQMWGETDIPTHEHL
jgi:hypothetical protein